MKLTKEEFKELLLIIKAGSWVRSAVAETNDKDWKRIEKWEEYFAKIAKQLGYEDLVEVFQGKHIPHKDICIESEKEMEEYNNEIFWHQLEVELGKRDFYPPSRKTSGVSPKDISEENYASEGFRSRRSERIRYPERQLMGAS